MNQQTNIVSKLNLVLATFTYLAIIFGVATFIAGERQRHNLEVYQAWQTINTAHGQSGDGGRRKAIKFLNSHHRRFPWFWKAWYKQSLNGLNVPKANLFRIDLSDTSLLEANFQEADLGFANFQDARLNDANFK